MTPRTWVPNVPISTERDIITSVRQPQTNNYLWRCFHTRCTPDARTLSSHLTLLQPNPLSELIYGLPKLVPDNYRVFLPTNLTDVARVAAFYFVQLFVRFKPTNRDFATLTYNCLVEIELHREIYHFTHERQPLKLDSNQHSAISRGSTIELLSDEV